MHTRQGSELTGELLRSVISETATCISRARYAENLRALVLTGSLARDEATFQRVGSQQRLLGDVDLFLVFDDAIQLPAQYAIAAAAKKIEDSLLEKGVIAPVGLSAVHVSYLRTLPQHIATYELRSCARVLWGDAEILSLIPAFTPKQISREDAWRMLANRTIELMEAMSSDACSRSAGYSAVKLLLDSATSYLVFAGHYRPTYREREKALRSMVDEESGGGDTPFPLNEFADRVKKCTEFKLDGNRALSPLEELQSDALHFAHLLWRWQLRQLTGENRETSGSRLMTNWMARQPLGAKIRGWLSLLRRCGGFRTWRDWPRWSQLGWQASPRYWIYSVAFEALPHLSPRAEEEAPSAQELVRRLPLVSDRKWGRSNTEWQQLINVTALHYRRLLEDTTA